MLNVLFLIINFAICCFFIYKKNGAILGYLVFFQDVHLIPFENIQQETLGYIYYILIATSFLLYTNGFRLNIKELKRIIFNPVVFSLVILTLAIIIHYIIIGVDTDRASILVFRYFTQVLPAMVFIVLIMNKDEYLYQLPYGVVIFGSLLILILVFSTDFLDAAFISRSMIRDETNLSPLAVSRIGCMLTITILFIIYDNRFKSSFKIPLYLLLIAAVFMIFIGMSRGPLISIVLTLIIALVLMSGKNQLNLLAKFSILLPIIILIIVLNHFYEITILNNLLLRFEALENIENIGRYRRYELAYTYLVNEFSIFSPFFLYGLGPAGFDKQFGMGYAHNFIMEMIFEYGIVGVIFLILFIGYSLKYCVQLLRSKKIPTIYKYIPTIFLYLLISSMFSGDLIARRNLFFVSILQVYYYYYLKNIVSTDNFRRNINLRYLI